MNAADFCALSDSAKRAHTAKLTKAEKLDLMNRVADHHQRTRAEADAAADPFRLRANAEFRKFAERRATSPQERV